MGMPLSIQASRSTVGAYSPPTFRPGSDLLEKITTERGTWAVFHALDGLSVPALENTAEWHRHRRDPCAFLKPATAEYLDTAHTITGERLLQKPHAFAQMRDLTAAVWLDIGGAAMTIYAFICDPTSPRFTIGEKGTRPLTAIRAEAAGSGSNSAHGHGGRSHPRGPMGASIRRCRIGRSSRPNGGGCPGSSSAGTRGPLPRRRPYGARSNRKLLSSIGLTGRY